MSKLTVGEEFWTDPRIEVMAKEAPRHECYGAILNLWRVGQLYWRKNKQLIPKNVFDLLPLSVQLVGASLVVIKSDGVYCVGAQERWVSVDISKKRLAGSKSAESRRQKKGTKEPKKRTERKSQFEHESTPSNTSQHHPTPVNDVFGLELEKHGVEKDTKGLIATFCVEYKKRYNVNYRITGKDINLLKSIQKSVGIELYAKIVSAYLNMADKWFINKRHDIATLHSNLAKVSHFEQTRRNISQSELNDMDRTLKNNELISAAERGEI